MQMTGIALVLRPGPEAGDAAALVVGVKGQVQADGIVDAAQETHARVRLFFHDVVSNRYGISLCCLNYSIDAGIGQTTLLPSSFGRGPSAQFVIWVGRTAGSKAHPCWSIERASDRQAIAIENVGDPAVTWGDALPWADSSA
jgi:hypothetical protein